MNLPVFNFCEPIFDLLPVYIKRLSVLVIALFVFVNLPKFNFAAWATVSRNEFKVSETVISKNRFTPAQPSNFRVAFYGVDYIVMAGGSDSTSKFGILTQL